MEYLIFSRETDELVDVIRFETNSQRNKYLKDHPNIYLEEGSLYNADSWEEE